MTSWSIAPLVVGHLTLVHSLKWCRRPRRPRRTWVVDGTGNRRRCQRLVVLRMVALISNRHCWSKAELQHSNGTFFYCRYPHATATDNFYTLSLTYLDRSLSRFRRVSCFLFLSTLKHNNVGLLLDAGANAQNFLHLGLVLNNFKERPQKFVSRIVREFSGQYVLT